MISVLLSLVFASGTIFNGNPTEKAWSLFNKGLSDKSGERRALAAHSLGLVDHNRRAISLARRALQDTDAEVRIQAAGALGEMHATQARPELRAELQDKDLKVVLAAAGALYTMHDSAGYEVYYALLTGERKSSPGLIQSQLATLENKKQLEEMAFQTGIGFIPYASMGWDAWKTITHDSGAGVLATAALRLATDPNPRSIEALKLGSGNKSWQVRAAVANAIAKRGDRRLLNTAIDMMLDPSDQVQFAAAGAVLHLEDVATNRSRASSVTQ